MMTFVAFRKGRLPISFQKCEKNSGTTNYAKNGEMRNKAVVNVMPRHQQSADRIDAGNPRRRPGMLMNRTAEETLPALGREQYSPLTR